MVFWLCSQVLEDRLLPVPLHVIPVFNLAVSDGVVDSISGCLRVGEGLIADEEIEVLYPSLRR